MGVSVLFLNELICNYSSFFSFNFYMINNPHKGGFWGAPILLRVPKGSEIKKFENYGSRVIFLK